MEANWELNSWGWSRSFRIDCSGLGKSFDRLSPHRHQFLLMVRQSVHADTDPVNTVSVRVAV